MTSFIYDRESKIDKSTLINTNSEKKVASFDMCSHHAIHTSFDYTVSIYPFPSRPDVANCAKGCIIPLINVEFE